MASLRALSRACDTYLPISPEKFFVFLSSSQLCGLSRVSLPSLKMEAMRCRRKLEGYYMFCSKQCPVLCAHCNEVLFLEHPYTLLVPKKQCPSFEYGPTYRQDDCFKVGGKKRRFSVFVRIRDSYVANWHRVSPPRTLPHCFGGTFRFDFVYNSLKLLYFSN
jgi:hypothetical protein